MIELLDPAGLADTAARLHGLGTALGTCSDAATSSVITASGPDAAGRLRSILDSRAEWAFIRAADLSQRAAGAEAMAGHLSANATWMSGPDKVETRPFIISDRHRELHRTWQHLADTRRRLGGAGSVLSIRAERVLEARQQDLIAGFSRKDWMAMAILDAGIDPDVWRPAEGLSHNELIVTQVYEYYGQLWIDHPELEWAAMANLVGPSFYAGWQDLRSARRIGDDPVGQLIDRIPGAPPLGGLVALPGTVRHLIDLVPIGLDRLGDAELLHLERAMLDMQQQIFTDMAWRHTAYAWGGVTALDTAGLAADQLLPWRLIASGTPALVRLGNAMLLRREQETIIQDDYDGIRDRHGVVGDGMTYLLTWMAGAPLPGSHPYREVVTRRIDVPSLSVDGVSAWPPAEWLPFEYDTVPVQIPRGNVAEFDDRWEWIAVDIFPAFTALMRDRDMVVSIIETPIDERAAEHRLFG